MALLVQVNNCKDIPKVQRVGVQDPYVVVFYAGQNQRTKTHENGGTSPVYNETLTFNFVPGNTILDVVIYNSKVRQDEKIATARLDFSPAFKQGTWAHSFPVVDGRGNPHGEIHLGFKVPLPPPGREAPVVAAATAGVEKLSVEDAYARALSDARAKFYADVETAMVPHKAVTGALADSFVEALREVKEDDEKEVRRLIKDSQGKAGRLAQEALKAWAELGAEFRGEIIETLVKHDPAAKDRFAKHVDSLETNLRGQGAQSRAAFAAANKGLQDGLDALLDKYIVDLGEAVGGFESGFKSTLGHYRSDLEEELREEAEKKSREAAAKYGPPPAEAKMAPPPPPAAGVLVVGLPADAPPAAAPQQPVYAAPSAPPATGPYPYPPPPVAATPSHVHHHYHAPPPAAAAAAGAAVGAAAVDSKADAEAAKAKADAQLAQQQAYLAQQQAQRAQYEAEMQRQQAARAQAVMRAEVVAHHHRRAVRRGVAGGVIIGRALD